MSSTHTRTLDFPTPPTSLERLVDAAVDADLWGVSIAALLAGHVNAEGALLWATRDTRTAAVARWCERVGGAGYASLVGVALEEVGRPEHLSTSDLAALPGHGVCVASAGVTGESLLGLDTKSLRRELTRTREALSEACGHEVRALLPRPDRFGRALDPLIWREAMRAGYTLVVHPHTDVLATRIDPGAATRLCAFSTEGATPQDIGRWLRGDDDMMKAAARAFARRGAKSVRSWFQGVEFPKMG